MVNWLIKPFTMAVLVGVLTLVAMMKIWVQVFWAPPSERPVRQPERAVWNAAPPLMVAPTVVLVVAVVAIGVFAGPLAGLAERAAGELLDPAAYRAVVAGTGSAP